MKIVLGTAQFGLNYGVSNNNGKTTKNQASEILDFAWNSGVDTIDTANAYGDSEQVIGKLSRNHDWNIITKTPHCNDSKISKHYLLSLDKAFNQSLFSLKTGNVDTLLVHSATDLIKPGGALLYKKIKQLKEERLIRKIGVSVYDYKQIDYILDNYHFDIIQLPISIIDQRLITSGHLGKIKLNGIEIHARSVFLQGLLLMPLNILPSYFSKIYKNLNFFSDYASEISLTKVELALGYVQSIKEIDKIVVGVNTVDQLHEIINASTVKVDKKKCLNISVFDEDYINPYNWKL
jgi:aryl-alcohol dehydrogenase-like predicted oxidoreductase